MPSGAAINFVKYCFVVGNRSGAEIGTNIKYGFLDLWQEMEQHVVFAN